MTDSQQLTPVSYHLRQFNKYAHLDMPASKNGNLTIIGENAVGKTTLANCFFPMLIDGAIATPSFNAAKGTDKISQSATTRNSARDTRTFESMLLGWGPGAMKVRTGYTYMRLAASKRQVILGIGAHRATGDTRKPTWWFVVISDDPSRQLNLQTTDSTGACLDKAAFLKANGDLGADLHLFESALDYRDFVASRIYGFSNGETLGKLANVYRLLASPILTSGNAKFSPIKAALQNAQEGIDDQVIQAVANSQREVNRNLGLLDRLKHGQDRLQKLQNTIFWGNLNHLNELILSRYSDTHAAYEQAQIDAAQAQQKVTKYADQIKLLQENIQNNQAHLDQLRDAQIQQKSIRQQRALYQTQIDTETKRLQTYQYYQDQLTTLTAKQQELQDQQNDLAVQQDQLQRHQLSPLQAQISTQAAHLTEFASAIAQINPTEVARQIRVYLRQLKQQLNDYHHLADTMASLSEDVAIVQDMQGQMATSIDQHLPGPLLGRARPALQQDNQTIHTQGAAKMNAQYQALADQQAQLLDEHPDLRAALTREDLVATLTGFQKEFAQIIAQIEGLDQEQANLDQAAGNTAQQIQAIQNSLNLDPDFEVDQVTAAIAAANEKLANLVIDPTIDDQLAQVAKEHQDLTQAEREATQQKSMAEGRAQAAATASDQHAATLQQLRQAILEPLTTLAPYCPDDVTLADIDATITFVTTHRAKVRGNSYAQVSNRISHLIHNNNRDGVDRDALDVLFEDRDQPAIASAMRQQHAIEKNDLTVVAFDLHAAQAILAADRTGVEQALTQLEQGNDFAQTTYLGAATQLITAQYQAIDAYNDMLVQGAGDNNSIKLKVALTPATVTPEVIAEARDPQLEQRPALLAEIKKRLEKLANDADVADDEGDFQAAARALLDTRQWSDFNVLIKRRQSAEDNYEAVDNKFVQSGGSGAEKAQAMVLPLLLVPKMVLRQATLADTPYLVMFDEFADKLDPETAKSFVNTIARFGFCFIATMPNGAQNKILADGVANIAYTVLAPQQQDDGLFHQNRVEPALIWQQEVPS
ncbi:chromosome segregation ATPase [Agrilactobacillus composti DSM 18527 = JCM 14202]|uniref:Chromosome segregation ATPase n=1 Tax=Agrilactobacillus composti DSM 18527 = JCM 14202 TaxID=1423734 RepID=A0A0R1XS30_9LACO|nr:SbcC/MukB-like Walker B domain-containing protein [Agrilactobacillus composti]KRM32994.1 chromosome segregation ATPase [Agrilactobacillus composti DSM 18527 = JCM 14202]